MNSQFDQNDTQKLEPGEISERSSFVRWLDNFWYHNKWTVIVSVFFAVVLIVCLVQILGKTHYDAVVSVVVAATPDSGQKENIEALLSKLCPEDFNGNGEKQVCLRSWQVYSDEEYKDEKESAEAESQQFSLNAKYNEDELKNFQQYVTTGECSVCLVSPFIYEQLRSGSRLKPLTEVYGADALPAGAMEDGYGIALSGTDLYTYNEALYTILPDTTILCLLKPTVVGDSSKEENYQNYVSLFRALADYRLSE